MAGLYIDNVLPTDVTSGEFGFEKLTIASNVAQGADQDCRECWILVPSGNTGSVTLSNTTADANSFDLLEDTYLKFPISNTNKLYFYSPNDNDVIWLLWRS